MIPNRECNQVYFSSLLRDDPRYGDACIRITKILGKHNVKYSFLEGTKDIWCRDYMPVQLEVDEFIAFKYEPSYLQKRKDLKSVPKEVCQINNIRARFSEINLDGGNVVNWKSTAILTTRVFDENKRRIFTFIKSKIEKELDVKVHLVSDIEDDMTGHVDGHLRFLNENTFLVNELKGEESYWVKSFKKMIRNGGFSYIEMPWFNTSDEGSAVGIYVNYLEVGNLIIFPVFEVKGNRDHEALAVIKKVFPERIIEPININTIAKEGGLMNCISWQVKT